MGVSKEIIKTQLNWQKNYETEILLKFEWIFFTSNLAKSEKEDPKYVAYQYGKQTRLHFQQNKAWRPTQKLQLINADVGGPKTAPNTHQQNGIVEKKIQFWRWKGVHIVLGEFIIKQQKDFLDMSRAQSYSWPISINLRTSSTYRAQLKTSFFLRWWLQHWKRRWSMQLRSQGGVLIWMTQEADF